MQNVGKNWFLDEFEAVSVIADCDTIGVSHEQVAFSVTNNYLHGMIDRKIHDYFIISDDKEFYGEICEEEKIIPLAEAEAFLSVLEKRGAKEEKTVFIFIDELSDLLSMGKIVTGKLWGLVENARHNGLRFVIYNSVAKRSLFASCIRSFCDGHIIARSVSGAMRLYIVDDEVYALNYVISNSAVTVSDMQKALLIGFDRATKYFELFEAHGIIKKSDDDKAYRALTDDLRTAYGMLKTDKTE